MRVRAETLLIIAMSIFAAVGWMAVEIANRQSPPPRPDVGPLPTLQPPPPPTTPDRPQMASDWFEAVRGDCTPQGALTVMLHSPPPQTDEGRMYEAACHALAGRIADARRIIADLPEGRRQRAAGVVFEAGHATADAGDDIAAGPLMEVVVEFWPDHYMALYHAGSAAYQVGDRKRASRHLTRFLEEYRVEDGWRTNALTMLERIQSGG